MLHLLVVLRGPISITKAGRVIALFTGVFILVFDEILLADIKIQHFTFCRLSKEVADD